MGRFTFSKAERLSKEKWIKELFEKGSSFYLYPFKIIYLQHPQQSATHQILITVSNRLFKKAIDRNLIKRRIREAYRLQKHSIQQKTPGIVFVVIYTAKEKLPFADIKNKMFLVLEKIKNLEIP